MFANFIYFIIVLVIYATYQPSGKTDLSPFESFAFFLGILFLFTVLARVIFQRIEIRISKGRRSGIDRQYNLALSRLSILAIIFFFIDIYILHLPSFFAEISLFKLFPTVLALIFIGCFVFYLIILWACAYNVHQKLYPSSISRYAYIASQLSFSLPVLIPWFLLSATTDLIQALPFNGLKRFLSTPYGEISYFFVFIIAVVIIGPALIQKVWRCKPLEAGYKRWRIERLCQKAGLKYAEILRWPILGGITMTAAVMGLVSRFRYILISPALLHFLEPEEIDAVIAHETGHIKKNHLLLYLVFFIGYIALYYAFFDLIMCFAVYSDPVCRLTELAGLKADTVNMALMGGILVTLLLIYFRYIFGYIMRNFERQADIYVYTLLDDAQPLISAFRKIAVASGQPLDRPNWHHFSLQQRIEYLEKCEADRSWISRHHRKIHKIIAVYLIALALTGIIGYQLNHGRIGDPIRLHCQKKIILHILEKSPDQKNRFSLMGDLYYSLKNYEKTIAAYEQAIIENPANVESVNNLAWLYATCEEEKFRNPERALLLARRAAKLQPSPHILDTLAESYFVNGFYEEAVDAALQALEEAVENRSYYEKQLKKFSEALEKDSHRF